MKHTIRHQPAFLIGSCYLLLIFLSEVSSLSVERHPSSIPFSRSYPTNRRPVWIGTVSPLQPRTALSLSSSSSEENTEWTSDFGDFVPGSDGSDMSFRSLEGRTWEDEPLEIEEDDDDDENDLTSQKLSSVFQKRSIRDLTGTQTRQFSLGQDLILADYVGNLGFDEVTDWEYYEVDVDEDGNNLPTTSTEQRKVVQPNPMDASKPKRTRTSSGSVVRVFRGEFVGRLGGALSARGLDKRVLVKEFTGEMALQLARYELLSIGKLQSDLFAKDDDVTSGDWIQAASSRSVLARKDDRNVGDLIQQLTTGSFLGILGEVNLAELEGEMEPNEFYRALGVPPPKPEAVW